MSYYNQIMNLPCDVNISWVGPGAYKAGHRDARFAAAEVALEADTVLAVACQHAASQENLISKQNAQIELLAKNLEAMTNHYISLINSGDVGNWDPLQELEVAAALDALKATKE